MNIKHDEIDEKLGMNIRLQRTRQKMSQEKLAELAGIGTTTMSNVELGKQSPTAQMLAKISNALNIELYKLFIFD